MAGGKSDFFEEQIMQFMLGDSEEFPKYDYLYLALSKDLITDDDTGETLQEPNITSGYQRIEIPTTSEYWVKRINGERRNLAPIVFPRAVQDWGVIFSYALCTEQTGGEIIWHGSLLPSRYVEIDDIVRFDIEDLIIRED